MVRAIEPLWHYVVIRADLPVGMAAAQIVHAAGESAAPFGVPADTRAIVLQAKTEGALQDIHAAIIATGQAAGWRHPAILIRESEGEYAGQLTAIGVIPCARDLYKDILGPLRLYR